MKRHISTFLAIFILAALLPAQLLATAKDVNVSQKNASDSAWTNVIISPTANSLLAFNGSKVPISTVAPTGITSMGVNIVSSATGQPLTFQTGTFGTGLSFASATGIGTFVKAPTAPDFTLGTSGPSISSTLSARAGAQGLVFSGVAGATVSGIPAFGKEGFAVVVVMDVAVIDNYGIIGDVNNAFALRLGVDGTLYTSKLNVADNTPIASGLVAGKTAVVVYSRSGTTATYYVNGVSIGTRTDANNYTVALNTIGKVGALYFSGSLRALIYNRALTAAEVVKLYETEVPAAGDLPTVPAGTALLIGDDSDFDTVGNWTDGGVGCTLAIDPAGTLKVTSTGVQNAGASISSKVIPGIRYRVTFIGASIAVGTAAIGYVGTGIIPLFTVTTTPTDYVVEFTAENSTTFRWKWTSAGAGEIVSTQGMTLIPLGALACYSDTQPGRGSTWYDVSGNSAHITLPAGVTWAHPSSLTTPLGGGATIAATAAGAVTVTPTAGQNLSLSVAGGSKVGIGMTPVNTLDVTGSVGATGNLTVSGTGLQTVGTGAAGQATPNVTIQNHTYGGIYIHDGATALALTSAYAKITNFNNTGGALGLFNDMTRSTANSQIVAARAGTYKVQYSISGTGTNNHDIHVVVFAGTSGSVAEVASTENMASVPGTGTEICVSGVGFVVLTSNQVIELWMKDVTASANFTVKQCNLIAERVSN